VKNLKCKSYSVIDVTFFVKWQLDSESKQPILIVVRIIGAVFVAVTMWCHRRASFLSSQSHCKLEQSASCSTSLVSSSHSSWRS